MIVTVKRRELPAVSRVSVLCSIFVAANIGKFSSFLRQCVVVIAVFIVVAVVCKDAQEFFLIFVWKCV